MDKFKPPKSLEDFKRRAQEANIDSIPVVIKALERQRDALSKPLSTEIKFHESMLKYLTEGTLPEGLN